MPRGEELADLRAGPGWPLGPPGVPGAEWEGLWEEAELSPRVLSESARAAIIKYHGPGGLNSRNLFSCSFGAWEVPAEGPAGFLSGKRSRTGLQMATLLHPHAAKKGSKLSGVSSCKGANAIMQALYL